MKKTAVMISGQLRGIQYSAHRFIEKVIARVPNPDVFYYGPPDPQGRDIRDYYPNAKVLIEEDDLSCAHDVDPTGVGGGSHLTAVANGHKAKKLIEHWALQWYSVMRCSQLVESGYDYGIRARADTWPLDDLIEKPPESNIIYIPDFDYHDGINDRFAYGTMESMHTYCEAYTGMKNLKGSSERRLGKHLRQENINVKFIDFTFAAISQNGAIRGVPIPCHTPERIDLSTWAQIRMESNWVKDIGYFHPTLLGEGSKERYSLSLSKTDGEKHLCSIGKQNFEGKRGFPPPEKLFNRYETRRANNV